MILEKRRSLRFAGLLNKGQPADLFAFKVRRDTIYQGRRSMFGFMEFYFSWTSIIIQLVLLIALIVVYFVVKGKGNSDD